MSKSALGPPGEIINSKGYASLSRKRPEVRCNNSSSLFAAFTHGGVLVRARLVVPLDQTCFADNGVQSCPGFKTSALGFYQ